MRRKFIYQDDNSHKFWDIEIAGTTFTVYFGKAGMQGQTQTKDHASEEECKKAADKLIAEKTKKGYVPADETIPVENATPEPGSFPPRHLYHDLLTLAQYLQQHPPAGSEVEVVSVTAENIDAMEAAAGFEMPEAYGMHWLRHGSLFFSKDNFICSVNAFNAQGTNANNLYGLLTFYQGFYRRNFPLIEEERAFLSQCCWVVGMIIDGDEMRIFVSDPQTNLHIVHFAQSLRSINADAFAKALSSLLQAKDSLSRFIQAVDYPAVGTPDGDDEDDDDTDAPEKAETQAFLDKYNIRAASYEEVLDALQVNELFGYWSDGDENRYADDYESERDYFGNHSAIYYCDGDLTIGGDLEIPHVHIDLLVVRGNMTVQGRASSGYGSPLPYCVAGDTTIDYLNLGYFQKTFGAETVRYVASAWANDDEMIHSMPFRRINAPYFFSWFYDLACFEFAPHTLIVALYNYDEVSSYETGNAFLAWHDYAHAFRPELCYDVTESHYDVLNVNTRTIYETLRNNQPILREGVTHDGIILTREGIRLKKEDDNVGAYRYFKEAIAKSPGYYLAYYHAGQCLFGAKAYGQAKEVFANGIPLTPARLTYETACWEQAALCAVRVGEYDQAIAWGQAAVQKNAAAHFALRVIGEALVYQNKLDAAKDYLTRALKIKKIFTSHWLLGLVYHLQGDKKNAEIYYTAAVKNSSKAQPYEQHTTLHYLYGDTTAVDWDTTRVAPKVKDQAYWNQYLANVLNQYGPDLYKRVGKFPAEWVSGKVINIPEQHRTKDMLLSLLKHTTKGEYDVTGEIIMLFKPELYTQDMILLAVRREDPCSYKHIPEMFLTPEVFASHPGGIDLSFIPNEQRTYDLCFQAVAQSQYNYKYVPAAFQDERMSIALIAGGGLKEYPARQLPSKYYSAQYVKQALALGVNVIKNIPVRLIDREIYAYATDIYGQDPAWPFIVEQYDRQRWQWGSASDVETMGNAVRKYGLDIFEHVDADRINRHSYGYYKKHLGHLPAFEEKAKAYGWTERSNITNEHIAEPEFDYNTFSKVWPCFWDEAFIIKALTAGEPNASERIYHIMPQHLTPKICAVAVKRNSYDFQFVPKQWITPQMCEEACAQDYGGALEFVPVAMRTQQVCELSLRRDTANIRFVPVSLRTPALCAGVMTGNRDLLRYIPHEHYAPVFEILADKFKNRFEPDYLALHGGLGLILQKDYAGARKKLADVASSRQAKPYQQHQAVYYTGWSCFLEGDTNQAQEYWKKSQDIAKKEKIDDAQWLTYPYAQFQLPEVPGVYDFSQDEFDQRMREITLLVQNKDYTAAIDLLSQAEQQLREAQHSEMRLWAYVWDHQRYALYEAGKKEEAFAVCRKIIDEIGKIILWDYLEEFNSLRGALRSAHNSLAYRCYETATDLNGVTEGLKHIKTTMKTIAPIEDKSVLDPYYETHALLLHKATGFDPAYQKDFDKVMTRITKSKLHENGLLSNEFIEQLMRK